MVINQPHAPIGFGDFVLDPVRFELRRGAEVVRLQPKTYDVLAFLVANPGIVVKEELVAAVWPGVIVTDHSLTRCIKDLRKALGDDASNPRYIETVARRGYRFLPQAWPVAGEEAVAASASPRPARIAWLALPVVLVLGGGFAAVATYDPPPADAKPAFRAVRATSSFDALQAFQGGHELLNRRPAGWRAQALAAFDRAIALDPGFAAAHAGRAMALAHSLPRHPRPDELRAQARASVDRALGLDKDSALAHSALGLLRLVEGDAPAAEGSLRRAVALDPTLGNAYNWLGMALVRQGRSDAALAVYEAGARADPLNPALLGNIGTYHAARGNFGEARAAYSRLARLPQRPLAADITLLGLSLSEGRLSEALSYALRWEARADAAGVNFARLNVALVLARLGAADEARSRLRQVLAAGVDATAIPEIDRLLATLGDRDKLAAIARPLAPAVPPPWLEMTLGRAQVLGGELAPGVEVLARGLERKGRPLLGGWGEDAEHVDSRLALVFGLQRTGRVEDARAEIDRVLDDHRAASDQGFGRTPHGLYLHAMALGLAGRGDDALAALAVAVERGWNERFSATHDPRWDALRGEARFRIALARAAEAIERERAPARLALAAFPAQK